MKTSTVLVLGLLVSAVVDCCNAEEAADGGKHGHLNQGMSRQRRSEDEDPSAKGRKIAAEKSGGKSGGKGKEKGKGKGEKEDEE